MNSDDYQDCEVMFKFATRDAILVVQNNEEHWIPRSVLAYSTDKQIGSFNKNETVEISLRAWFAVKKGMYDAQ